MSALKQLARQQYFRLFRANPSAAAHLFIPLANKHGVRLDIRRDFIDVVSGDRVVRISHRHQVYLTDVTSEFDFYHSAVEPILIDGVRVVDYSTPRYHDVLGFDLHPVLFPSLAEPIVTTEQYLDFGQLLAGAIVLDLGAYSGLTSILFDAVGKAGRVIAIDADRENVACIRKNVSLYQRVTGRSIEVLHGAVWDSEGELEFSSEGNMGSSAAAIVGGDRGNVVSVRSYTLNSIAQLYALDRVDFIKCDIEGAEAVIFNQPEFFARFKPRIIVEVHPVDGKLTSEACRRSLAEYGYECREVPQPGASLPLLECVAA
jgi:FkbM family methyltransferase